MGMSCGISSGFGGGGGGRTVSTRSPVAIFAAAFVTARPLTVTRPASIHSWTFVLEASGRSARWRRRTRSRRSRSSPRSAVKVGVGARRPRSRLFGSLGAFASESENAEAENEEADGDALRGGEGRRGHVPARVAAEQLVP